MIQKAGYVPTCHHCAERGTSDKARPTGSSGRAIFNSHHEIASAARSSYPNQRLRNDPNDILRCTRKAFGKKFKKLFLFLCGVIFFSTTNAQSNNIYISKDAFISFFSSAPIEDIAAQTNHAVSAINMKTGDVFFKIPMRTFEFKRALMQQHFNTEYLETDKYPFATFKGKIQDFTLPDSDGTFPVTVDGQMTIHGVTKEYKVPGTLELKNGQLTASASFNVRLADHHIEIPTIVFKNIAEVLAIKVKAVYAPLKKDK